MAPRLLVLHGPNVNLLGQADIDRKLEARADELGVELRVVQAHHEGGLLEALHDAAGEVDAVLANPGVLAPQAFALAEGLRLVGVPSAEVLLSALPPARGASALTGIVTVQVHGRGAGGYLEALEQLASALPKGAGTAREEEPDDDAVSPGEGEGASVRRGKHIGRKAPVAAAPERAVKSIGRRAGALAAVAATGRAGKSLGRAAPAEKTASRSGSGVLTRALVREKISLRLKGSLSAEALAAWARQQWSALQQDLPHEAGARETLDGVLLTLMAGAKVGDHVLLAQAVKLDR